MATKMASNPTTLQELQRREVKKPLSGRIRPTATKATTTKSSAPSLTNKGAGATKVKDGRLKKLKEEQEAEKKKRLEEKQSKEQHERAIVAEKRKAMEEKRKDAARKTTTKDKVASLPLSAKATSKPGGKESSVIPVSKSAPPRSADTTDGAKAPPGNKTTLSSLSSRALATKKPTSGLNTGTSAASPKGISNGVATIPSKVSKPVAPTSSRSAFPTAVASTKPSPSKTVVAPSRPLGSKLTSSNPQGIKVATRVAPTSSRPQSARTSVTASTGTACKAVPSSTRKTVPGSTTDKTVPSTTRKAVPGATDKAAPSKQMRAPAPSLTHLGIGSAPSKSATRAKASSSATSGTKIVRPGASSFSSSTASGKAATTSSAGPRVVSAAKAAGSGKDAAASVGVKKPVDVTKPSSRIPKTLAKTAPKTTTARATSLSSPRAPTKVIGKASPKISGGRHISTAGKRLNVTKTTKSSSKGEPVKDIVTLKPKPDVVMDQEKGTDDVMVIIETEVSVRPDSNGVGEVPVSSALTADNEAPPTSPPAADSSVVSETPPPFTQAAAQRAGQIISLQTSLSKELQSKLPRLGDILDSAEGIGEEDVTRDINPKTDNGSKVVNGEDQLDDGGVGRLDDGGIGRLDNGGVRSSDAGDSESAFDHVEITVEVTGDEEERKLGEEREERRKRVDVIMERTRVKGHDGLEEEEMAQTLDEDIGKPSDASISFPIIPDPTDPSSSLDEDASVDGDVVHERDTVSTQDSFEFRLAYEQQVPLEVSVEVVVEESERNGDDNGVDIVESNIKNDVKADMEPKLEDLSSHIPDSLADLEAVPSSEEGDDADQQGSLVEAVQDDQSQKDEIVVHEKEHSSPDGVGSPPCSPTANVTEQEEKQDPLADLEAVPSSQEVEDANPSYQQGSLAEAVEDDQSQKDEIVVLEKEHSSPDGVSSPPCSPTANVTEQEEKQDPLADLEAVPSSQEVEDANPSYQQGSLAEAVEDDQSQKDEIVVLEKEHSSPDGVSSPPCSPTANVTEQEEKQRQDPLADLEAVPSSEEGEDADPSYQQESLAEAIQDDQSQKDETVQDDQSQKDEIVVQEKEHSSPEYGVGSPPCSPTANVTEQEEKQDPLADLEAVPSSQEIEDANPSYQQGSLAEAEQDDQSQKDGGVLVPENEHSSLEYGMVTANVAVQEERQTEEELCDKVEEVESEEMELEEVKEDDEEEHENGAAKEVEGGESYSKDEISGHVSSEEHVSLSLKEEGEMEEEIELKSEDKGEAEEAVMVEDEKLLDDAIPEMQELISASEEDLAVGDGLRSSRASGDNEVMIQAGTVSEEEDEGMPEVENEGGKDGEFEVEKDSGGSREDLFLLEDDKASSSILKEPAFTEENLTVGDRLNLCGPTSDSEFHLQAEALAAAASTESSSHISNDPLVGYIVEPPLLNIQDSSEPSRNGNQEENFASVPQDIFASSFSTSPLTFDPFTSIPKEEMTFDPFNFRSKTEEENAAFPLQQPLPLPGTLADKSAGDRLLSLGEDI